MTKTKSASRSERGSSVVLGRDKDVLPLLITTHAVPQPRILDVTYNRGVMWKGTPYTPHRADISREFSPDADTISDCRDMPFPADSWDVIVFDPPHLPSAVASANSSGIERRQYGLDTSGDYRQGDNIDPLFRPFLREAKRVLTQDGIVLAKLADFVHNHKYQWSHVAFIQAAIAEGMTPCDVVIKADPTAGNLKSSKWQHVHHLRRGHAYWIVIRRDARCERKTR